MSSEIRTDALDSGRAGGLESPVAPDLGRFKVKRNLHYWLIGTVVSVLAIFLLGGAIKEESHDEVSTKKKQDEQQKKAAALAKTGNGSDQQSFEILMAKQAKEASDVMADRGSAATKKDDAALAGVPDSLKGVMPAAEPTTAPKGLPEIPGSGAPNIGLPSPAEMRSAGGGQRQSPKTGSDDEEMKMAQREEKVLAAPILAIDGKQALMSRAAQGGSVSRPATGSNSSSPVVQFGSGSVNDQLASIEQQKAARSADLAKQQQSNAQNNAAMMDRSLGAIAGMNQGPTPGAAKDRSWLESGEAKGKSNDLLKPIASPGAFALMEGSIIPAVLISEIRSDLPGQIKSSVSMDVYDSSGNGILLIPKGSTIVGRYNSEVRIGQEKVLAAFQRLIYPNGASVDLNGMLAAEAGGASGMSDEVDNHFFKMFATNFMIAGLAQIFAKDAGQTTVVNNGTTTGIQSTAGQTLADTVKVINERNKNIPPTIYVYRGHKFNIMVNKDMYLPPYLTGAGK